MAYVRGVWRRLSIAGWLANLAPMLLCLPGCVQLGDVDMSTGDLQRKLTLPVAGNAVSYVRSGDEGDRRIIYVHGTPGDAGAFAEYVRHPVGTVESVSVDRPGFGQTGGPVLVSFEAQAAAISPLLVRRDGHWPVLVGHSLGGPIVARVAADYPDRVSAIVIVAGSLDPGLEGPRWFNFAGAALTPVLPRTLRVSNAEIFAAGEQTRLLHALLDRVRCPVVIVHGTQDALVPYANVDYMRRAFVHAPSVEVVTIPNAGHFIPWTHQAIVRDAIERALELGV